jgi:mannose-1-phosphate guanylyltransferase
MFREQISEYGVKGVDANQKELWGVILAGGDGNRLKNFVEKIYGYHRPKQYCKLTGDKSLIQHTFNRTKILIPQNRLVTIANKYHFSYLKEELKDFKNHSVILQPENRDTCAGILLPVLKIYSQNKNAIVATFPSDHFVQDSEKFMNYVNDAYEFVKTNEDAIVMLGITPDKVESGYGWIERENNSANNEKNISRVIRFWEKPDPIEAVSLLKKNSLWNTFVMVGTATSFIKYIKKFAKDVFISFENIIEFMGSPREKEIIEKEFPFVPAVNFSQFVLEKIPEHLFVLEVPDVYWNDWGEEHRIISDLKRFELTLYQHENISEKINSPLKYKSNELVASVS